METLELNTLLDQVTRGTVPSPTRPAAARRDPTSVPTAMVLVVHVIKCTNCNVSTRALNPHVLIRYGERTDHLHSIHYQREATRPYQHLPREVREVHRESPYCEECF